MKKLLLIVLLGLVNTSCYVGYYDGQSSYNVSVPYYGGYSGGYGYRGYGGYGHDHCSPYYTNPMYYDPYYYRGYYRH